jgi:Dolichyl-phosphate-mannose-protein mannosyltransferase
MQILKIILKNYSKIVLALIFIIALTLRWWYLPQKAISFAYDQARDAFVVQQLLGGHLKLLGPPVSGVPGLFHGVLYYYVIAPAYLFGHGDPVIVAYWLSFISSLGVFVVYFLTKLLIKNKTPALIAALIFAFSFEATQYANLLTNASMAVWFVPLIYIGLYLWINKSSKWAPIITGLAFGLSVQSEVALAYQLVPIVLWLYIFRARIKRKEILTFVLSFIVAISSMIVSEIKFGFTGASGIVYLLTGRDQLVQAKNLSDFIITFLDQSGKTFAYTMFPLNVVFGGLLGFLMTIFALKNKSLWSKFLATYIFAYLIALPFGGWNMRHILVGIAPAVSVFTGIFLWKYLGRNKLIFSLILAVILGANLMKILTENINGQTIFPLQVDLVLSKEIAVVDYTYQRASGKPFSISTLTSPLFVNSLWSYLYNWYGNSKYGYLPNWVGRDQVDQLGNNLQTAPDDIPEHFFIMEPTYGIPDLWVGYAKGDQDSMSNLVGQKNFGQIVVQERIMKNAKQ